MDITGVTRRDKIRNEFIRRTVKALKVSKKRKKENQERRLQGFLDKSVEEKRRRRSMQKE